jgi:hypothetical protein
MAKNHPAPKRLDTEARPLAHMTYFKLVDHSEATLQVFIDLCKKYLSGHRGQTHFSIGPRATEMTRDVNVLTFDVAMNMIFATMKDYKDYREHSRHIQFIRESVGLSSERFVFDSYIDLEDTKRKPKSTKKVRPASRR